MSYQSSVKKCNGMLALARAGATIWWRREGFHQETFQGVEPKWHVLTGRFTHHNNPKMQSDDNPVWTALCGYKKPFDERIFEMFPGLRKTAPKKDTRCRKGVSELPAHLEQFASHLTEAAAKSQEARETQEAQPEMEATQP
ncbi:UNVERIFIED_ORG: hypothetical protein ABIB52_000805 [Arthrobacter sp. UYCu721]